MLTTPFKYATFNTELAAWFLEQPVFAFDIETDTADYSWNSGDRGLSYCADSTILSVCTSTQAMVLVADPVYSNEEIIGYEFCDEQKQFIIDLFSRSEYIAIAHNFVFDARQIFGKFNLDIPDGATFWDTLAINILGMWVEPETNSLEALENHYQILSEELRKWWSGMKKHRKYIHRIFLEEDYRQRNSLEIDDALVYCIADAYIAYELWNIQANAKRYNNSKPFDTFEDLLSYELEYTKFCVETAAKGINLNYEYTVERKQFHLQEYYSALEELGGTPEDWRKPAVLRNYILQHIPEGRPTDDEVESHPYLRTKTGALSFSAEALEHYMKEFPDLYSLKKLKDHEATLKRIDEWLRHAERDGRIHSMLVRNTVTGRNSSSMPNVQNIDFRQFAGYLTGDNENCILCEFDYSNAENRIAAMYARDDAFARACASDDFHSVMAQKYFGELWDNADKDKRKELRRFGKIITFGTAYGMGAYKLAWSLQIPVSDAKEFLRNKDLAFPQVTLAKAKSTAFAEQHGYTILWSGRRVAILKKDGQYKGYTAWNSLAQGGVAELVVRAIVTIRKLLRQGGFKSRIVTQIHDSIILNLHIDEYEEVVPIVIEVMSSVMPDEWNNRTTPVTRWLTDLDHLGNSKKWGYRPNVEYPFPTNTYVNRWGFHEFTENEKETPTWINQWGYGETALIKELAGSMYEMEIVETLIEETLSSKVDPTEPTYDWQLMYSAFEEVIPYIGGYEFEGRTFSFPESVEVLRTLCHNGIDTQYLTLLEKLDILSNVFKDYRIWREKIKGC